MAAIGGLYVTGSTTNTHFTAAAPVELGAVNSGVTWTAQGASAHGAGDVVAAAATGRLTLRPGIYEVCFQASIENNQASGLSSEDVTVEDVILAYLAQGGTKIAGCQSKIMLMEGLPTFVSINAPVEITRAMAVAATPTNYVSAYLQNASQAVAGTTSDVIVSEARLWARRIE